MYQEQLETTLTWGSVEKPWNRGIVFFYCRKQILLINKYNKFIKKKVYELPLF